MSKCSIPGCSRRRKYVKTGWCQTHYHRNWRTGSTDDPERMGRPYAGEDGKYRTAHNSVSRLWGPATNHYCVSCGRSAGEWAYDGTDPTEKTELAEAKYLVRYSVWPEFYMPMCVPCHRLMDGSARALRNHNRGEA